MAQPLTSLLKKDYQWHWIEAIQTTFQSLKEAVCQALVLILHDFQESFCVKIDACGIRAMLQQKGKSVAFFSNALGVKH